MLFARPPPVRSSVPTGVGTLLTHGKAGVCARISIIAAFGGFLPVPGHLIFEQSEWDYRNALSVLGPAATVWGLLLLALFLGSISVNEWLESAAVESLIITLTVFVVVDLWVVVWPFDSYNGRVIYDWNRAVWAVLSGAAALMLLLHYVIR